MSQVTYYVRRGHRHFGPFTGSKLKQLAVSGTIHPDDIVVQGDKSIRADKVKALFDLTTRQKDVSATLSKELGTSASDKVKVICPGCQAEFQAQGKHLGRKTKCPKCETELVVAHTKKGKEHVQRLAAAPADQTRGRRLAGPPSSTIRRDRSRWITNGRDATALIELPPPSLEGTIRFFRYVLSVP